MENMTGFAENKLVYEVMRAGFFGNKRGLTVRFPKHLEGTLPVNTYSLAIATVSSS